MYWETVLRKFIVALLVIEKTKNKPNILIGECIWYINTIGYYITMKITAPYNVDEP